MHKIKSLMRLALFGAGCIVLSADAEIVMYQGFPATPGEGQTIYRGFTADSKSLLPAAGTYVTTDKANTLVVPACFSGSPKIPVSNVEADGSILFSSEQVNATGGAKLLTLADNCQSRKKSLYFRFLIRADQAALDGMREYTSGVPYISRTYSCGILWAADNYTRACVDNTNLRFNKGLSISAGHNPDLETSSAWLSFARGFVVDLVKERAGGPCSLNLYAWGKGASDLASDVRRLKLLSGLVGGKTYICFVRLDIDAYVNGDDRLCGFAQPVEDYDPAVKWTGQPFMKAIRADIIGSGGEGLFAHLAFQGASLGSAEKMIRADEIGLATEADELAVHALQNKNFGDVLAYDGFPCCEGGYSASSPSFANSLSTENVFGFSERWSMYISKGTICLGANGTGLSLPSVYSSQGILPSDGTSIQYSSTINQNMYVRRAFTDGLLARSTGEVVNMRLLISATPAALKELLEAVDMSGTLNPGEVGTQKRLNYFGGGIGDCSVQLETDSSHAPTLCKRGNACFFTFTRDTKANVGLYLNLLSGANDTPVAYKILDVDKSVGGTFLCFAQIEVGTGAGGKERIRAFACNVSDVTDKVVTTWLPSGKGDAPIEHELIDAERGSYPRHAMIGGAVATGFLADEFGVSLGVAYPLVWAKYPSDGLMLLFR